jgi:hypothetical protein
MVQAGQRAPQNPLERDVQAIGICRATDLVDIQRCGPVVPES